MIICDVCLEYADCGDLDWYHAYGHSAFGQYLFLAVESASVADEVWYCECCHFDASHNFKYAVSAEY